MLWIKIVGYIWMVLVAISFLGGMADAILRVGDGEKIVRG